MAIPGLKMGPLDPDRTESFGQVGRERTARDLLRRHQQLYPQELLRALRLPINEPRSKALVPDEVRAAARDWFEEYEKEVPEGFVVEGASVHGADDGKQFVGYTFRVASGRSGKAALPYDDELFPESYEAGTERVRIEEAKRAGLPWVPRQAAEAILGGQAPVEAGPDPEAEKLRDRVAELEKELAEARQSAPAGQAPDGQEQTGGAIGDPSSTAARQGHADVPGEGPDPDEEPWERYADENADVIKGKLRGASKSTAEHVLAYEEKHGRRSGVIGAANAVLSKPGEE